MRTMKDIEEMREFMKASQAAEEGTTIPDAVAEAWGQHFEDDPVNNPSHYQSGGMEVIEIIDEFTPDAYSYYMGNVLKYLLRHAKKNNPKQDLEKARWYLDKMIKDWP